MSPALILLVAAARTAVASSGALAETAPASAEPASAPPAAVAPAAAAPPRRAHRSGRRNRHRRHLARGGEGRARGPRGSSRARRHRRALPEPSPPSIRDEGVAAVLRIAVRASPAFGSIWASRRRAAPSSTSRRRRRSRSIIRSLSLPSGVDEVAREEVSHIVASSVEALEAGRPLPAVAERDDRESREESDDRQGDDARTHVTRHARRARPVGRGGASARAPRTKALSEPRAPHGERVTAPRLRGTSWSAPRCGMTLGGVLERRHERSRRAALPRR